MKLSLFIARFVMNHFPDAAVEIVKQYYKDMEDPAETEQDCCVCGGKEWNCKCYDPVVSTEDSI